MPYYWAGLKAYDMVAGKRKLEWSYFISKKRSLELFPMLKHDKLVGALVYYDGGLLIVLCQLFYLCGICISFTQS